MINVYPSSNALLRVGLAAAVILPDPPPWQRHPILMT
jgi:hypothetical protein